MATFLKKLAGIKSQDGNNPKELEQEYDENEEELEGHADEDEGEEKEHPGEKGWLDEDYEEGQLSIDVYQNAGNIIVKSTIAGVKPEDIDISLDNDMLTIRGKRTMEIKVRDEDYLYRECYWGNFSRSIILPVDVIPEKIEATLENGVLTVVLPKAKQSKQVMIKVKEK